MKQGLTMFYSYRLHGGTRLARNGKMPHLTPKSFGFMSEIAPGNPGDSTTRAR